MKSDMIVCHIKKMCHVQKLWQIQTLPVTPKDDGSWSVVSIAGTKGTIYHNSTKLALSAIFVLDK